MNQAFSDSQIATEVGFKAEGVSDFSDMRGAGWNCSLKPGVNYCVLKALFLYKFSFFFTELHLWIQQQWVLPNISILPLQEQVWKQHKEKANWFGLGITGATQGMTRGVEWGRARE